MSFLKKPLGKKISERRGKQKGRRSVAKRYKMGRKENKLVGEVNVKQNNCVKYLGYLAEIIWHLMWEKQKKWEVERMFGTRKEYINKQSYKNLFFCCLFAV